MKYPGGKRRQAPHIVAQLLGDAHVSDIGRYDERFVGAGAVYLELRASGYDGPAYINDVQPAVVATWRAVQRDPAALIAAFNKHAARDCREYLYAVRRHYCMRLDVDELTREEVIALGAWFLYINKAGFNGLFRVNQKGLCNTPYGDGKPPRLDEEAIRIAHEGLRGTVVACRDFAEGCDPWGHRKIEYDDPPFLPRSKSANFVGYARGGFSPSDQIRLANWAERRRKDGVRVVMSNAGTPESLELFNAGADRFIEVRAPRVISCKGQKREPVTEYLFIYDGWNG